MEFKGRGARGEIYWLNPEGQEGQEGQEVQDERDSVALTPGPSPTGEEGWRRVNAE